MSSFTVTPPALAPQLAAPSIASAAPPTSAATAGPTGYEQFSCSYNDRQGSLCPTATQLTFISSSGRVQCEWTEVDRVELTTVQRDGKPRPAIAVKARDAAKKSKVLYVFVGFRDIDAALRACTQRRDAVRGAAEEDARARGQPSRQVSGGASFAPGASASRSSSAVGGAQYGAGPGLWAGAADYAAGQTQQQQQSQQQQQFQQQQFQFLSQQQPQAQSAGSGAAWTLGRGGAPAEANAAGGSHAGGDNGPGGGFPSVATAVAAPSAGDDAVAAARAKLPSGPVLFGGGVLLLVLSMLLRSAFVVWWHETPQHFLLPAVDPAEEAAIRRIVLLWMMAAVLGFLAWWSVPPANRAPSG